MSPLIHKHKGFTIIEITIVLLVLSVLVALAVPVYGQYAQESRRNEAKELLLLNAQRLQRCFTLEGSYNSANCFLRTNSESGYYTLASTLGTDTFDLSAVPVAGTSQDSDAACTMFNYDHIGTKSATGADAGQCW